MYGPYHLKAMIDQRHEEALREAQTRRLAKRTRSDDRPGDYRHTGLSRGASNLPRIPAALCLATLALAVILLGAAGCADPDSSDADAYEGGSDAEESTLDPTPDTGSAIPGAGDTDTWEDPDDVDPEQYEYDPAPDDETVAPGATETAGLEGEYLGLRYTAGMSSSTSMECYSFSADGNVELRHNGAYAVSDRGTYQADSSGWLVYWDSGRTSRLAGAGDGLSIDGLEVESILSCLTPESG